jgi:glycosidase
VVYSIQTLGFCDCEGPPSHFEYGERLARLIDDGWLDHVSRLGCTVLYLGPLMKTSEELGHGYDTADYFEVDPRLGTMATLRRVVEAAHALQIRVIVDGVFNHTGRDHFAARDVLQRGSQSQYWSGGRERNRREFPLSPFPRVVGACSAAPLALVQCVLYAVLHSRSTSRVK